MAAKSLYETEMFEKTIKDLYEMSLNSDVGYLLLIENVFDAI